jgi:hypothetical protein
MVMERVAHGSFFVAKGAKKAVSRTGDYRTRDEDAIILDMCDPPVFTEAYCEPWQLLWYAEALYRTLSIVS